MSDYTEQEVEDLKVKLAANYEADPDTGCWNWTGWIDGGYGRIMLGHRRKILAHKASYMVHIGGLPSGSKLYRTCKNRKCINPWHLTLGEESDRLGVSIESVRNAVRGLGQCVRAVDVAIELELPSDVKTLAKLELILEDPDHFAPTVKDGKKFYQAI